MFAIHRFSAAAVATLTLLAGAAVAQSHPAMPELNLGERGASGERAIILLGNNLPAVAAHHRIAPEVLIQRLRSDASLKLDQQGRLYFADDHLPPAVESEAARVSGPAQAPLADTFFLHSRPGAQRTIYLDFDGAVITGTAWNGGGGPINALPFDFDGNTASFSDAELTRIQAMWQRVAEDYAPFDVDVTTEQPPAASLTRTDLADMVYGTTVVVTHNAGVYACSCGGVAYLSAFDNVGDYYKPALVFWNMLSSNEKYVAEAISHEAGHNLNLYHDGDNTTGYYAGHGSGPTGWAPIMGVGYYQPLVQWSKGEYTGANNTEDDIVVMQNTGAPLRADDHGNTQGAATAMTQTGSGITRKVKSSGVVSTDADVDMFSFNAGAGTAKIKIVLDSLSPNLDARLVLRDAGGNQLAASQPKQKLTAKISATLPASGTYYISVEGVGKKPVSGTGYSGYASLGQYSLSGTVQAP